MHGLLKLSTILGVRLQEKLLGAVLDMPGDLFIRDVWIFKIYVLYMNWVVMGTIYVGQFIYT